jgi:hypothetical protein
MTRRTPPCVICLKIDTAKNRMSSHVNDIILIEFDFPRGFQICDQNRHASPGAPPAKNRNTACHPGKRSKRLRMSQGSILHTQNLNLRPGAQLLKIESSCMSPEKMPSGSVIMQGPTLYAQYCQMSLRSLSPKK